MKIPAARIYFPQDDQTWCLERIKEALGSGQLTLGKHGKQLEEEFAKLHNVKHAVAVNSGTSALEIPLRIWEVEGKEVVVPDNTFFATAAAVVHAGAIPRFADVSPDTFALSLDSLKKSVTSRTFAVVVVHIGGLITPEIEAIRDFCTQRGLLLLEDAAHAQGCSLNGKMAGTFGAAAAFSFYPTKVMTSGEGGVIVSNDDKIKEEAQVYRDQGKAGFYGNFHVRMGYNWRMSEVHAILGLVQLRRLKEFIEARNRMARVYDGGLRGMKRVRPILMPPGVVSNYYKYMALLDKGVDRAALKKLMKEKYEVGLSGEVYETPLHLQPVFKKYVEGAYPISEDICSRQICLPVYANMTEEEAQHVVSSLRKALDELK